MSIKRIGRTGGAASNYRFPELLKPGALFLVTGSAAGAPGLFGNLTDRTSTACAFTLGAGSDPYNILVNDYSTNLVRESFSSAYSWRKNFKIYGGGTYWKEVGPTTQGPADCDNNVGGALKGGNVKVYGIQPGNNMVAVSGGVEQVTTGAGSISWCAGGSSSVNMYVHFPDVSAGSLTYRDYQDLTVKLIRTF